MADPVKIMNGAIAIINATARASTLAAQAIEAANDGDIRVAQNFLDDARARYREARDSWDDAAQPGDDGESEPVESDAGSTGQ